MTQNFFFQNLILRLSRMASYNFEENNFEIFWTNWLTGQINRNFYLPNYKVIYAQIKSPYRIVTKYVVLENFCFVFLAKKVKKPSKIST